MTKSRELAEKIIIGVCLRTDIKFLRDSAILNEVESILDEALREAMLKATETIHADIYWQAGEIEKLTKALEQARLSQIKKD